jgi:RND superfamily putative drug exporter
MSHGKHPNNLAARMGRWSARHWKLAVFGWLAFVVVAFLLGNVVGKKMLSEADAVGGEAGRAQKTLSEAGFEEPASELVLIQSKRLTMTAPEFRRTIGDVVDRLRALPDVANVRSPLDADADGQTSQDGRSALVQFDIRGEAESAKDRVQPILDAVAGLQRRHPGFFIGEVGGASFERSAVEALEKDFVRAELLTIPATAIIMLLAFGALVAAGLPVLLGVSAVLGALGLSALVSHVVPASGATQSVILLVGLAVGVDYALFYLKREREERAAGRETRSALLRTAATSGEAVLISGATVMIALAGMFLGGTKEFQSIAVGAIVVVAVAIIGSLSVLPALMSKLGDRIEKGRIPLLGRGRRSEGSESRFWGIVVDRTLRRPPVSVALAMTVLVALSIPAFGLETKLLSGRDLPRSIPIVQTYDRLQEAFPGTTTPAVVVVTADDVNAAGVRQAIEQLRERAVRTGVMTEPVHVAVNPSHTIARIEIPIATADSRTETAYTALATLRDELIPSTIARVPGVSAGVTGETAANKDLNSLMQTRLPLVFAFVLGFAFLLLLATFRSIVIPIKAIVLNLLSVGASYGILVLVFQHSWAEGLLGFETNGGIASWLPLFLFVLLFGLSMDYHVFILSRVKELVDDGVPTEEAVARAIRRTAGTVTSASLVMVVVFAIFATLRQLDLKQAGFGLAVAVFLDATIIRGVLLPASMKLLADWNWYLPRWLAWLPKLGRERPAEAAPTLEPAA